MGVRIDGDLLVTAGRTIFGFDGAAQSLCCFCACSLLVEVWIGCHVEDMMFLYWWAQSNNFYLLCEKC